MGTKLTGKVMDKTPVVGVKMKLNGVLVCELRSMGREVKLRRGKGYVYEAAIKDTDFPVQKKNDAGEYVEVDVRPGDIISFFAPTVLHMAIQSGAAIGDILTIKYLGEATGKNGIYHNYDVEKA